MLLTKTFWSATNSAPCIVPFPNISKILLTNFGFSNPSFIFSKNSANLEEATPACIGLTAMQILVAPLLILQGEGGVQIQFFVPECFGEIHGTATGCLKGLYSSRNTGGLFKDFQLECLSCLCLCLADLLPDHPL